jgi:hypothetical protein
MASLKELKEIEEKVQLVSKINGQVKDTNFDWSLIFPEQSKEKEFHLGWLLLSIVTFLLVAGVMVFIIKKGEPAYTFTFAVGLMSCIWLACCAHLRFKKVTTTSIVSLGSIIVFSVSAGIYTPEKAVEEIKSLIQNNESSIG